MIGLALAGQLIALQVKEHDLGHRAARINANEALLHSILPGTGMCCIFAVFGRGLARPSQFRFGQAISLTEIVNPPSGKFFP